MNRNLEKALLDIEKVEALMYAIENAYLDIETVPSERAKADKAINAFYALWDSIRTVADDIDKMAGDAKVIDVIYAVNEVTAIKSSLTKED